MEAVNGDARKSLAVLASRVEVCQKSCGERSAQHEAHLERIETSMRDAREAAIRADERSRVVADKLADHETTLAEISKTLNALNLDKAELSGKGKVFVLLMTAIFSPLLLVLVTFLLRRVWG